VLNPVAVASVAATPPDAPSAPAVRSTTAAADPQNAAATKLISTANPSYVLDLGLGLVVLQYHDQKGEVTSSIPSERQLQAYRDGGSAATETSGKPAAS
jgi:hypothetical protein